MTHTETFLASLIIACFAFIVCALVDLALDKISYTDRVNRALKGYIKREDDEQ